MGIRLDHRIHNLVIRLTGLPLRPGIAFMIMTTVYALLVGMFCAFLFFKWKYASEWWTGEASSVFLLAACFGQRAVLLRNFSLDIRTSMIGLDARYRKLCRMRRY